VHGAVYPSITDSFAKKTDPAHYLTMKRSVLRNCNAYYMPTFQCDHDWKWHSKWLLCCSQFYTDVTMETNATP